MFGQRSNCFPIIDGRNHFWTLKPTHMGRRKRVLDDNDSDSSVGSDGGDVDMDMDQDTRDERALFEDPYQRKRKRRNGKKDALYGVFASDSDEDDPRSRGGKASKRSDWAKAPAFVSGDQKVDISDEMDVDNVQNSEGEGDDNRVQDEDSDTSEPSRPPSPRVIEEEEEEDDPPPNGLGSGGIGFSSGLGASPSFSNAGIGARPVLTEDLPTSFGNSRTSSFIRETVPTPPASLSSTEKAHFSKISGSFGSRMLEKMGWTMGTGLGVTGAGIVTPVESKLRPQRAGIAFRGFKEKTEQSKAEARRRGEAVSDDEDAKSGRARKKAQQVKEQRSDAWKKPKKVKTKLEHKTYEEIIAAAGPEAPTSGLGQIIDATGAVPREVSSLADVSLHSWTPSSDPTRIPEIRHNIRLIAESCKTDLDGLAREGKALHERRTVLDREDARLRKKVEDEAQLIARLQQIQVVANEINAKAKELAIASQVSLDPLSPLFYTLSSQYAVEVDRYRLDEIAVAAIAPLVRRLVNEWSPMESPSAFIATFRNWRALLKVRGEEQPPDNQVDIFGTRTLAASAPAIEKPMTPFESLLWNVWLPKVRTAINNEWDAHNPDPAVKLYEAWSTFLPPFIRDNLMDQLILPKVQKAVSDWNPKNDEVSLQAIVFPWLPHVGLRLEDLLGDARRKVKSLLRSWIAGDEIPRDLKAWKDVSTHLAKRPEDANISTQTFDKGEWDKVILKYVVPKLGALLRKDFRVNPRNQIMEPILQVFQWFELIRPSVFSQILETEFFPKWLDVLHFWLTQPNVSPGEVAEWYEFWKEKTFPEPIRMLPGVTRGFTTGLQLMFKATELGPNGVSQLPRPEFRPEQPASSGKTAALKAAPARPPARVQEITFRSIVEEVAADNNLLFMPSGKAHEKSRMPLFRVTPHVDGKGGLLVYILDDAVWASQTGLGGPEQDYRAISLEDMVSRATS